MYLAAQEGDEKEEEEPEGQDWTQDVCCRRMDTDVSRTEICVTDAQRITHTHEPTRAVNAIEKSRSHMMCAPHAPLPRSQAMAKRGLLKGSREAPWTYLAR